MNKIYEHTAKKFVVPIILKLLKPYKAGDMTLAITDNVDLSKGLSEDTHLLGTVKALTFGFPFIGEVGNNIKKKKWILWFLNGPMRKKRPDLFNTICYTPGGTKYILKEIRRLVTVIFD